MSSCALTVRSRHPKTSKVRLIATHQGLHAIHQHLLRRVYRVDDKKLRWESYPQEKLLEALMSGKADALVLLDHSFFAGKICFSSLPLSKKLCRRRSAPGSPTANPIWRRLPTRLSPVTAEIKKRYWLRLDTRALSSPSPKRAAPSPSGDGVARLSRANSTPGAGIDSVCYLKTFSVCQYERDYLNGDSALWLHTNHAFVKFSPPRPS